MKSISPLPSLLFDIFIVLQKGPSRSRLLQIPISFPQCLIQRQQKLSTAGTHSNLNFAPYFHTHCINELDKSESVPHIVYLICPSLSDHFHEPGGAAHCAPLNILGLGGLRTRVRANTVGVPNPLASRSK